LAWFKRGKVLEHEGEKKKKKTRSVFLIRIEEMEVLAIENHRLCFDITQILNVVRGIFFNKTWDYVVIRIHDFNNTKKHKLL
jgi:hypothetical protein